MIGIATALIDQIGVMFFLMAAGFALFRMGILGRDGIRQMADIVVFIACPALTLRSLMVDFDAGRLTDAAICFALTAAVTIISIPLTRLFFKQGDGVARYGAIFSNSGFIGVPLVSGVFGFDHVFYLSIGTSCLTIFIWTYGVLLISGDSNQISLRRLVMNPNLIMIGVGLACFLCSIHPAPILAEVLDDMGALNTGLVMLVLGAYLAQSDLRAIITSRKAYTVCLVRLVIVPAMVIVALALLPEMDITVRLTMLVALGAPVASLAAIMSARFEGNYKFGIGIVALSTLLSLVSLPIALAVASILLT